MKLFPDDLAVIHVVNANLFHLKAVAALLVGGVDLEDRAELLIAELERA